MEITPIRNKKSYFAALDRLEQLKDAEAGSKEAYQHSELESEIDIFEDRLFSVDNGLG